MIAITSLSAKRNSHDISFKISNTYSSQLTALQICKFLHVRGQPLPPLNTDIPKLKKKERNPQLKQVHGTDSYCIKTTIISFDDSTHVPLINTPTTKTVLIRCILAAND